MFDLSNMFSKPTGWGATVKPEGAFFAQGPNGITGLAPSGQKFIGRGLMAAGEALPGGYKAPAGAFSNSPPEAPPQTPPEAPGSSPWSDLIANWRKHMTPGGV